MYLKLLPLRLSQLNVAKIWIVATFYLQGFYTVGGHLPGCAGWNYYGMSYDVHQMCDWAGTSLPSQPI